MVNNDSNSDRKSYIEIGKENIKKGVKFSKDYQPSKEAMSRGQRKRRTLEALARTAITGQALTQAKELSDKLGLGLANNEITLEILLILTQVRKAVIESDTAAFNACLDRLIGKAPQTINQNVKQIDLNDLKVTFE